MMRRRMFCTVTRKTAHAFDAATHRCPCGQWERGYKPKKEFVRPRAECQICEGAPATETGGCLGHHGYRRPGCGFIQGDCMGVGYQPYPKTDALEIYLRLLDAHIERTNARLAVLPTLTEYKYHYTKGRGDKKEECSVVIRVGDRYHYDAVQQVTLPAFDDLIQRETRQQQTELRQATEERTRVVNRIAKAATL